MRRILIVLGLAALTTSCNLEPTSGRPSNPETETFAPWLDVNLSQYTKTGLGVWYKDLRVGTGVPFDPTAVVVTYVYIGYLNDGTYIGRSGGPVQVPMMSLPVGWRNGMIGMQGGGDRRLVIPSSLAYGSKGGLAPPNRTVVIDVRFITHAEAAP